MVTKNLEGLWLRHRLAAFSPVLPYIRLTRPRLEANHVIYMQVTSSTCELCQLHASYVNYMRVMSITRDLCHLHATYVIHMRVR